ncbi:MAG: alpha/beta hydrolase [Lachnospiraceae bacterium]|nr:alpha/beta hydrolase [Lachnospiraceae bacterium]
MNIEVDGYNISYKITGPDDISSGDVPAVIMLQGWGTDLGVYDSVANAINDKYRFIQFDLPGFGSSDEPREAWNVDAYADFFCKFTEALGIKEATLIGHSYGGRIIIKLAARESIPFRIKNIVLIDSAGIMPKRSFKQKFNIRKYKLIKKIVSVKLIYALFPELIDDWRNSQGSADYRNASPMMRQCMVMAVNEDLTELLPCIKQDTLLIWGDKDTATPISDGKLMDERIPNSGLCILEGCGHFSFLEKPAQFKGIMRSYFEC